MRRARHALAALAAAALCVSAGCSHATTTPGAGRPAFRALVFFTAKRDPAHIAFVREAVRWLPDQGARHGFAVDTTSDWARLNAAELARHQVVVFLDTRPDAPAQRDAFRAYMERGGAWLGFHFAAFALTPSDYPDDWPWYHDVFLGAGQYASNTWRPTSAVLRVEDPAHPAMRGIPRTFRSSPNEWYRWQRDLRRNPDIDVLLAIDPASFPLGTGPKPSEIWHDGYYPVAWTNRTYRMIYFNMGHDDIDYEHRYGPADSVLSHTFGNPVQDRAILDALLWLGSGAPRGRR